MAQSGPMSTSLVARTTDDDDDGIFSVGHDNSSSLLSLLTR
jgi:hypothetical protein